MVTFHPISIKHVSCVFILVLIVWIILCAKPVQPPLCSWEANAFPPVHQIISILTKFASNAYYHAPHALLLSIIAPLVGLGSTCMISVVFLCVLEI